MNATFTFRPAKGGSDNFELRSLHKLAHTIEDMIDDYDAVVALFKRMSNALNN